MRNETRKGKMFFKPVTTVNTWSLISQENSGKWCQTQVSEWSQLIRWGRWGMYIPISINCWLKATAALFRQRDANGRCQKSAGVNWNGKAQGYTAGPHTQSHIILTTSMRGWYPNQPEKRYKDAKQCFQSQQGVGSKNKWWLQGHMLQTRLHIYAGPSLCIYTALLNFSYSHWLNKWVRLIWDSAHLT